MIHRYMIWFPSCVHLRLIHNCNWLVKKPSSMCIFYPRMARFDIYPILPGCAWLCRGFSGSYHRGGVIHRGGVSSTIYSHMG